MAYRNKITLQLGLITFHVSIDGAVVKDEPMTTVCLGLDSSPHEPTPIKQKTACPFCFNDDYPSFRKARKAGKEYTIVDADEIAALKVEAIGGTKDTIALTPHPADEVHTQTLQNGSVYFLSPSTPASAKSYALLVDTLREHPEVAMLGFWTPVSVSGLYEIKVFGDTLVMEQRANPEQVKVVQVPKEDPDPMLKTQMGLLLPMMTQAFDPTTYANTYKDRLNALLDSKTAVEGADVAKDGKVTPTAVVDLTDQLASMLAGYQADAEPAKPAKKAAAKKAPKKVA